MYHNNYNYNYNYYTNKPNNLKNNYNFKNIEISNNTKRNSSKSRPKTPDFNKRGKSSSRFNLNNQRAKTPDRHRNKMKLNLNKDYLYTAENKSNKKIRHSNYINRNYNNTIDNISNNGKYQYKNIFKKLNTNDYFKLHKKTINNYDYRDTINANNSTLTSNSNTRKYSYRQLNNNSNQQNKKTKKLSKNCSQGNILGYNNYNINLNSNGINYVHKNMNEINNNNTTSHFHSNTNLVTPIKYINQKSNFKGEEVQMTQIRPPNYYNIYEETFQSFGTNIPTTINNEYNMKNLNPNKIKIERNCFYNNNKTGNLLEMKAKINKNNNEEHKKESLQNYINNYNNEKQKNNYDLIREKNGNRNYKTYVPATINNIGNKTYSYFNMKKDNNINQKENINNNNNNNECNAINSIDFNDLDQFSPPCSKGQIDLTNNGDNIKNNKNNDNIYINIGSLQEQNNNYNIEYKKYNYGNTLFLNENNDKNNRRIIDDFINQLKTKY